MKKTILIAAMLISFLPALNAYGAEPDRGKGQCSYHGGLNKDTGMCNDGTTPGTFGGSYDSSGDGAGDSGGTEAKEAAAKAKACKSATSNYNKYANSASWRKIQSQMLGDSADDCSDTWDEKYAPKLAKCKTDTCRNNINETLKKKYAACEATERWALEYGDLVEDAESKMNAACD
jgi:hypothetical protein